MVRSVVAAAVILALSPTMLLAAPLRTVNVGDRAGALTVGLSRFLLGTGAACGTVLTVYGYTVPGRPEDKGHASVISVEAAGSRGLVALAAYDESDLRQIAQVYGVRDGEITAVFGGRDAPRVCEML